ncbi:hypothetical protein GCM10022291_19250 [Postechiella marina]|uniref:Glycosyltransferase RgtA/B/C/D-like domain-containing protein n=1 Tax=Postechiella marina TaxID=943941 RepID=A0ABP8C9A5_9FLAO
MPIKSFTILIISVLILLTPKFYYLYLSLDSNKYTEKSVYNSGDETHYLLLAKNLSENFVYADNGSNTPTESAVWRSPIWPIILAALFAITNQIFSLILLKFIMELTLIALALSLYYKYGGIKYKFIFPFLLLLIEPQYIKYSLTFLSESITSIFILILVICFLLFSNSRKYSISIIVCALIVFYCHPVSAFFVGFLLLFYGLLNLKKSFWRVLCHALIFISVFSIWPIRNHLTFNKGFFITASQGATFSKGWNKNVISKFNNCDGDLANEGLNLDYLSLKDEDTKNLSVLDKSKLYKKATFTFLKASSYSEILKIILVKIKSNFNPFMEKSKDVFLEKIAVPFRFLYCFVFIQTLYFLLFKKEELIVSNRYKVSIAILAILLGQVFMSVYIYTGLRFNAIYSLVLLFLSIVFNMNLINKLFILIGSKYKSISR